MWRHHPQALRLAELVAGGRDRRAAARARRLQLLLDDPRDVRLLEELDGGGADGRRLLLHQRARGCSPASPRASRPSSCSAPSGVDRRLVATLPTPATSSRTSTARSTCPIAATSRPWARRASCASAIPGTAGDRHRAGARRRARGSTSRSRPPTPYGCELDDFAEAVAGEHPPRLGRADALGQARTIDAVLRAAASGERETRLRPLAGAHGSGSAEPAPQAARVEAVQSAVPAASDEPVAGRDSSGRRVGVARSRPRSRGSRRPRAPARAPSAAVGSGGAARARSRPPGQALEGAGGGAHAPRRGDGPGVDRALPHVVVGDRERHDERDDGGGRRDRQ